MTLIIKTCNSEPSSDKYTRLLFLMVIINESHHGKTRLYMPTLFDLHLNILSVRSLLAIKPGSQPKADCVDRSDFDHITNKDRTDSSIHAISERA